MMSARNLPEGTLVMVRPHQKWEDFIFPGLSEVNVPFTNISDHRIVLDSGSICDLEPCEIADTSHTLTTLSSTRQGHGEERLDRLLQTAGGPTPVIKILSRKL